MTLMRPDLPSGTVTLLFTDIEGSTRLLHELGAEAFGEVLQEHRRTLRETFARHGVPSQLLLLINVDQPGAGRSATAASTAETASYQRLLPCWPAWIRTRTN